MCVNGQNGGVCAKPEVSKLRHVKASRKRNRVERLVAVVETMYGGHRQVCVHEVPLAATTEAVPHARPDVVIEGLTRDVAQILTLPYNQRVFDVQFAGNNKTCLGTIVVTTTNILSRMW